MAKKSLLVLVLVSVFTAGIFGQGEAEKTEVVHKHQPFDMLVGINLGFGITPNLGGLLGSNGIEEGSYAIAFDFGATYDFYLFNWLSFNSGLFLHPDIYLCIEKNLEGVTDFTDIASSPLCLTIPFMAHINIPKVEWLYAGIGINLNIPIAGLFDGLTGVDTKGDFFVGLPIDIGFDFIKPGKGGSRLIIRITPEFHKTGTAVPIGLMWQIYNFKVYSKKQA